MLRLRLHESHQLRLLSRVIDTRGYAGTLITITPPSVLFDYQCPSSKPKPVVVSELRLLAGQ